MPQTIVKETTVYTLEELEALGWQVHEKALQNAREWAWEIWEPQWYTEDITYFIEEEFKLFDLDTKSLEWSTNPNWIKAKGDVNLVDFMRDQKLCNKYRSLFYAITQLGCESVVLATFGNGVTVDMESLDRDIDYLDEVEYQSPRYFRLKQQMVDLRDDISTYVDNMWTRLLKNLRAELDYRSGDEYAKETIEANEIVFTAEGVIYY